MEGRRNSVTDDSKHFDEGVTIEECVTKHEGVTNKKGVMNEEGVTNGDENNFCLSVVDQTLWQAAERTLTPMWEVATTGNNENVALTSRENVALTSHEPSKNFAQISGTDETRDHFSHHDKVSGKKTFF